MELHLLWQLAGGTGSGRGEEEAGVDCSFAYVGLGKCIGMDCIQIYGNSPVD
jgi:hypothetical protein